MSVCPKCKKQELKPGENLCPHCKNKRTNFLTKVGGVVVVIISGLTFLFKNKSPKA